jgi:putative PEP-CTERM system TPR-repeat lipoprotein
MHMLKVPLSSNQRHRHMRIYLIPLMVTLVMLLGACVKPPSPEQLLAEAKQYQQKGDTKSAIIQLSTLLQRNPKYGEARYLLGSIYLKRGDNLRAENQLREALREKYDPKTVLPLLAQALFAQGKFQAVLDATRSSDHGDIALQPEILSLRGHSQLSLGKYNDAALSFEEALKRDPNSAQALLGEVRLAINKRDLPAALKLTDKAIAAHPDNLDAWLMKGDLERSMNHVDDANAAYKKAFELNPHDIAVNMNMASIALAVGKLDEARKYVDSMRKYSPSSPIGNYFLGLIEFRQRNYMAADEAVQRVLKRLPNYIPAKALSGAVAFNLGSYEQAIQQLQDVVPLYPKSIYFRKLLATALLKDGKAQQSLDTLKPINEIASADTGLLALIAEAYYQNGELAKAKRYFEIAAKRNPKDSKVRAGLGMARLATGETERAIADLESAVKEGDSDARLYLISSLLSARQFATAYGVVTQLEKEHTKDDPNLLNIKGTILLARGKLGDARKAFERALEVSPGYFPATMNLASLDMAQKHFLAAHARYEKILEKEPSNIQAMMGLAKLESLSGRQSDAVTWLEHAKSLQPKAFDPNFALGRIFIEQHNYSKAIAVLRDALSAQPQHPEALNMLAYSQLQAGQSGNAVATYTKLTALYPKSAQALYGLGVAQAAAGNQASAIVSLQQTLELQPDFPDAIATLVNLQIATDQSADALKVAAQTQRLYPKRAFGSLLKGDIYMAGKEFSQAVHAYQAAFKLEKQADVLKRLHNALRMDNQNSQADGLLANWLKEHPDDSQIRLFYADAAIKQRQYALAIDQYRQVLQQQPDNLNVMHNMVWCFQQQHDIAKALQVAEQAYKTKPDAPVAMVDLASVLLEGQDTDAGRAVKLLEKARDLAPTAPETRYLLAKAYVKTGDKDRARHELKQVLISKDDFSERDDAARLYDQLNR